MPSLSHALVPNSFPLLHLIIYLDSYCTSMVTSNLIVSHHPRPNASYPADLLSHCFPGPLPPNPFICHTCRKSPRKPNHCHRSNFALSQLLSLPHIQDPPGGALFGTAIPFSRGICEKTRWHRHSCVQYQDMLYTLLSGDPLQRKVECQQRSTAVDRCWARSSSRTTLRQ